MENAAVANVTKNAIEAWIDAMQNMHDMRYNPDQQYPGVTCNDSRISSPWPVGDEIYK